MSNAVQTSQTELDAIVKQILPYLLAWLNTEATAVNEIERYYSMEGVYCLPALYDLGGVRKTVLVPVYILGEDARKAAEEARSAADNANQAAAKATEAAENANAAASRADKAREDLEEIKDRTEQATQEALKAAEKADNSSRVADEKMQEFTAQENIRQAAEQKRETDFRNALDEFDTEAGDALSSFAGNSEALLQETSEFLESAKEEEQARSVSEADRVLAENARQVAENKREEGFNQALTDLNLALADHETLMANPPVIRNGTWWVYSLELEDYVDTGANAVGHSPFINPETNTWWTWDETSSSYQDTGISLNGDIDTSDFITKEEFKEIKEGITPVEVEFALTVTQTSSLTVELEIDEENTNKLIDACKSSLDNTLITFNIGVNSSSGYLVKASWVKVTVNTYNGIDNPIYNVDFGLSVPLIYNSSDLIFILQVYYGKSINKVSLRSGSFIKFDYSALSKYPGLPSDTTGVVHGLVNGNWEDVCPAGKNLLVQAQATAASLALKSLQEGMLVVKGADEKMLEEMKELLGEDLFNELLANNIKTMELHPQLTMEQQIEEAKKAYYAAKVVDENVEPLNEESHE